MGWIETLSEFNIISVTVRMLLAMLLGGCIGLEREKSKRPAGFRTHILVCVGSCMTALIGLYVVYEMGASSDPVRIAAQVISGIGFLGVGTILVKEHDHITGLTTAAGLWTTAAIGIACGYGFYLGALLGTLVVAITSAILFKVEGRGRKRNRKMTLYVEVNGTELLNEYIDWISDAYNARNVLIVAPRTAIVGNVGLEVILPVMGNENVKAILEEIRSKEGVVFAMESVKREK
ncbi:MAG: MgtC/SapB family protein [Lachnospiraceae bacterium]|nr:MgtC/SapB family protein [Lachnospiraceae bacterium]